MEPAKCGSFSASRGGETLPTGIAASQGQKAAPVGVGRGSFQKSHQRTRVVFWAGYQRGGVAAVAAAAAAAAAAAVQGVTETEARTADTMTTGTGIPAAVEQVESL
jgi:hypothetical protein